MHHESTCQPPLNLFSANPFIAKLLFVFCVVHSVKLEPNELQDLRLFTAPAVQIQQKPGCLKNQVLRSMKSSGVVVESS